MAWSVLQSASATGSSGSPAATYSTANVSSGTVLLAFVNCWNGTASAVKDGAGNSFTKIATARDGGNVTELTIWAIVTPAGDVGTKPTITATRTGTQFWAMLIQEVSGIQAAVDGTAGTATFSGAPAGAVTPSYSSTAANEYLITSYADNQPQNSAPTLNNPSGWTQDAHNVGGSGNVTVDVAYKNSTNGSESDGWTGTTTGATNEAAIMVAFLLSSSAPTAGPVFWPFTQAVRARPPLARPGAATAENAPGTGNVSAALTGGGRGIGANGAPVRNPIRGPAVYPLQRPARARQPLPPFGRIASNPGGPVRNPVPGVAGPPFFPFRQPARIRPALPPRGRAASNPGGPVRNPGAVAVSGALAAAVRAALPFVLRGRVRVSPLTASAGTPPVFTGPPFFPFTQAVRARLPLLPVLRGRSASSQGAPVRNPSQGPVFRPAVSPAQARKPLPPRGRTGSNPGGPVQNPVPGIQGPPFFPLRGPARIRPSLPPRGRTVGSQGAPVRNPRQGAAFPAPHGPVQARLPLPPRGRTASSAGAPLVTSGPRFTQSPRPVQARLPLPARGRISSNPGIPVVIAPVFTGPPFRPLHWPARIHPSLPPRGRASANPGAPVRNPSRGPRFTPLDWPCRTRIPQNAPRGRTASNPGGPVANIPFGNPLFRLGSPRFRWDTGIPVMQWDTSTPVLQWDTGVPVTSG